MWRYTLSITWLLFFSAILSSLIVISGLLSLSWFIGFYFRLFNLLFSTVNISWIFLLVRTGLIVRINISDNILGIWPDGMRIIWIVWVYTRWVVYIVWAFRICIHFWFWNFLFFRYLVFGNLHFGIRNLILWIIICSYNIFITTLVWVHLPIILRPHILISIPIIDRILVRIRNRTFMISSLIIFSWIVAKNLFSFIILIFWFLHIIIIFNLRSCFLTTLLFSMIFYILVVTLWLLWWLHKALTSSNVDEIIFISHWFLTLLTFFSSGLTSF